MNREPDFVGNWVTQVPFMEQLLTNTEFAGYGCFRMYVEQRQRLEGKKVIKGTIEDQFGQSTFEGEVSDSEIFFTKRYTPEAILKGGHDGDVIYKGQRKENYYSGQFTVINGEKPGGETENWEGPFYVLSFSEIKRN